MELKRDLELRFSRQLKTIKEPFSLSFEVLARAGYVGFLRRFFSV